MSARAQRPGEDRHKGRGSTSVIPLAVDSPASPLRLCALCCRSLLKAPGSCTLSLLPIDRRSCGPCFAKGMQSAVSARTCRLQLWMCGPMLAWCMRWRPGNTKGDAGLRTWCKQWPEPWKTRSSLAKCAPACNTCCSKLLQAGTWALFVLVFLQGLESGGGRSS